MQLNLFITNTMSVKTLIPTKSVWDRTVKVEENGYYWKGNPVITIRARKSGNKPTVAEFFCGCGGTSKGFEMAGFDVILGADIHTPSIATFAYNHKNASTILGDLRKVDTESVKKALNGLKVNVMIAGVPCQGFSLNNRKRHEDDERNFLFKEYMRFVKAIQPDVVILENVSGLKSTANGEFVVAITNAIKEAGYPNVDHQILNAADYGVPQQRQRLVFIAIKDINKQITWPKPTHGISGGEPYVTVREAIFDLTYVKSGESANYYGKEPTSQYQKLMRKNAKELFNHEAPNHPDDVIKMISGTKPGFPMYKKFRQRIRLHWDKPSPTQVSGGIRPQFQFGHPGIARGETLRERCRIQSFPDNFKIFGGLVQGRVQTGNAVPPLLAKAVALSIKKFL